MIEGVGPAIGVERDQMPGAEIETVVTLGAGTCALTEVVEVGGVGTAFSALVVAQDRVGDALEPSPGGAVGGRVVRGGSVDVLDVAEGQDSLWVDGFHQVGGGLLVAAGGRAGSGVEVGIGGVAGDVPGRDDNHRGGRGGCREGSGNQSRGY